MAPREVLVTYTLYPNGNLSLQHAISGIGSQLPLRNLHWKSSTRTALRTIQELHVNLLELGEVPSSKDHVAGSLLESPLVNLCLVACDDAEIYKNNTKSFIRDWLSLLAARRNVHAPLIVLVNPPTAAGTAVATKNVFGRDKGILAKLKTDFNTTKRDRCVQVNLPPVGSNDPSAWPDVINKLKESIIVAFDGALLEREEEVKRGEAQRLTVGWNFCTWFLLKESLALSFEGINLCEDALIVYEELEAVFFQVLKEQNLSWFGKLGATDPQDDSVSILDTTVKPYRELIQSSTISIFDFRIYVFARQCALLGKLGRITEIAKRGQWFVASLTRKLRENEADLAEHFIESWTYTACMDLVTRCDEWSRLDRPNGDYSGLIAYESARAELLDIARVQVERIGVAAGHLPNIYPFAPSTVLIQPTDDILFESSDNGLDDPSEPEPERPRPVLSNRALLDAMADKARCLKLYLSLTKTAIKAYGACGKMNSVIRLRANLAGLALSRQDYESAYDLCRGLAKDCAEAFVWEPVARFALEGALKAHRELSLEMGTDWTNLALAYLGVCADRLEETPKEMLRAVEGLRGCDEPVQVERHAAFDARLLQSSADVMEGGTSVSIEITNHLSDNVDLEEASIHLEGDDGLWITYSTGPINLNSGLNVLKATCGMSVHGRFAYRSAQLSIGRIDFLYGTPDEVFLLVRRNPDGPKVVLQMPYNIALDEEPRVLLIVSSGKYPMETVSVCLSSFTDDVQFVMERSVGDCITAADASSIDLGDIEPDSPVSIIIPYSGSPQGEYTRAQILLQYQSSDEGITKSYADVQTISLGLPLTVNVQDFFRPKSLISNFTIASDGRESLRIKGVHLEPPAGSSFKIEECRRQWNPSTTITPNQPLSCLFKLDSSSSESFSQPLRLIIRYRSIDEEFRQLLEIAFAQVSDLVRDALERSLKRVIATRAIWLQSYLVTNQPSSAFLEELKKVAEGIVRKSGGLPGFEVGWNAVIIALEQNSESVIKDRILEIPVDVPQRRLLATVRMNRQSPESPVFEGQALAITLKISTSFKWTGPKPEMTRIVFDVQPSSEDWLVLGGKKGFFLVDPESIEERQVVLVPMRSGPLFLPVVSIHILPQPGQPPTPNPESGEDYPLLCEAYVENAAEVVHVLPSKASMTAMVPIPEGRWEVDGQRL